MHSDHDTDDSSKTHIIDEKSIQDKILSILAVVALIGLLVLGCYWQSLPLQTVQVEEESGKK